MDADYDYYIGDKSTDDFYTYNSRDFDESWGADVWDETISDLNDMENEMITEWD